MLTIFTIPKPFADHIGMIQRNALASWRRLGADVEILLLGNDAGVAAAAREFGGRHVPDIPCNAFGTPSVTGAFRLAAELSRSPRLMFSNADMLYDETLLNALPSLHQMPAFLVSGQRWDLDIRRDLTGMAPDEWAALFADRRARGRLHGPSAMDYFLFPRDLQFAMPEFAVGRVGWDSWLVWHCRRVSIPVIDATPDVAALHQNHSYASLPRGCQHHGGPERTLNIQRAGGLANLLTLREADRVLAGGRIQRPRGLRALAAWLGNVRLYQQLLAAKRRAQQALR